MSMEERGLNCVYWELSSVFLAVNIFSHADCLAVFIMQFGIGNETIFLIKNKDTVVMFNIRINGDETGGAVCSITCLGKLYCCINHKCSDAAEFFGIPAINR